MMGNTIEVLESVELCEEEWVILYRNQTKNADYYAVAHVDKEWAEKFANEDEARARFAELVEEQERRIAR